jgi:hypothetical protein
MLAKACHAQQQCARFCDISIGHYTWFVVTCNELSLASACAEGPPHDMSKIVVVDGVLLHAKISADGFTTDSELQG